MLDGIIKRINDLHCHDQVIIFSIPISICSWLHVNDRLGPLIAAQLDAMSPQTLGQDRQIGSGHVLVNQQLFGRVADGWPLHLGIDHDCLRHFQLRILIDIDVAVAGTGFDYRNRCRLNYALNQATAATRNQNVQIIVKVHQVAGRFVTGISYQLYAVFWQILV